MMLSKQQLATQKKMLDERAAELRDEIHEALMGSDNPHYIELAGQVHDREEESVADMLMDIQLDSIDRHVQELRDIEAAITRMEAGRYHICIACHEDIAPDRLKAQPAAQRCQPCQVEYERTHAGTGSPSL